MTNALNTGPARADVLQGLTGLLLVLFIWAHMFFESSILLGKEAMYWVTKMFEGEHIFGQAYPLLVSAAAAAVFILIVTHAIFALRKFPGSYWQYRRLRSHMSAMQHTDTNLWFVQIVTGFVLFFLASTHLIVVILQPDNIGPYASSDRIWSGRFWLLYAPLLFAVHLHAGIGIYRLVLKWAPLTQGSVQVVRRRLRWTMWAIIGFFLCLGSASLVTYMMIGREHAPLAGQRYLPAPSVIAPDDR